MTPKSDQALWNLAFSVLFAALLVLAVIDIEGTLGYFPYEVPFFDAVLIALAVFRVVRLFTYDKIMQWFRDLFVEESVERHEEGVMHVTRVAYERGPLRTMSELLACPWCTGVWAALFVVYLYFIFPWFWIPVFILAVASVGSFIQLIANAIGWRAEHLKLKAKEAGGE